MSCRRAGHAHVEAGSRLRSCTCERHKFRFVVTYQIQFCVTVARRLRGECNVNGAAAAGRQRSRTEALEREVPWLIPGDGEAEGERRQAHVLKRRCQGRTAVNRVTTETQRSRGELRFGINDVGREWDWVGKALADQPQRGC